MLHLYPQYSTISPLKGKPIVVVVVTNYRPQVTSFAWRGLGLSEKG